jgi:L-rhamnose-H+ transport protein
MNELFFPFLLVFIASIFQGTFGLGMKYVKPLPWEAWWIVYSLVAMIVLPLGWATFVVPDLCGAISSVPAAALQKAALFGFLWGVGGILFGVSVSYVGVSITYGIVMGLAASAGSLIPLAQMENASSNPAFPWVVGGVAVMLVGVAVCCVAGVRRDRASASAGGAMQAEGKSLKTGLTIAITSGVLSALLNVGFANAAPVAEAAVKNGALTRNSSLAAWVVVLFGATLMNAGYAVFLLFKNKTWGGFATAGAGKAYGWAILTGFLWFGALGVYGQGAALLGNIGPVIGWPILLGLSLIVSNALGFLTGEWKGAAGPFKLMMAGIAVLIVACCILGYANRAGAA